jgi:uncharacterized membrane protein YfcA
VLEDWEARWSARLLVLHFGRAFGWCVPIGGLGGLIGLGGGEFRLPVLMYGIGFNARAAVSLNLLTSLVTLTFALAIRSGAVSLGAVVPLSARNGGATRWWCGERLLWRAVSQPAE